MRHGTIALLLALSAVGPAASIADAQSAAEEIHSRPNLTILRTPAVLSPGDRAELVARTTDARTCRLRLSRPGQEEILSQVSTSRKSTIGWRWKVPAEPAASAWSGEVSCSPSAVVNDWRARNVRAQPVSLRVLGPNRGTAALVGRAGISAVVTQTGSGKRTEHVQLIVSILGLLVAGFGLAFVGRQLVETRRNARSDRTAQLLERNGRHEFIELWSRVGSGFLAVTTVRECFKHIRVWQLAPHAASKLVIDVDSPDRDPVGARPPAAYSEVWFAANYHEEVGVLFNAKSIARDELIRHFGYTLVKNFATAWWWIHWQRENRRYKEIYGVPEDNETELFAEWQRMVTEIVRQRPDLLPKASDREIWIVCIPAEDDVLGDWDRHLRLSKRLTHAAEELEDLEQLLGLDTKTQMPPPLPFSPRVLCVLPWREHLPQTARLERLAVELSTRLINDGLEALEALLSPATKRPAR